MTTNRAGRRRRQKRAKWINGWRKMLRRIKPLVLPLGKWHQQSEQR